MTSQIDPTKPEDGVPASKQQLRANLQAARDEISSLQTDRSKTPVSLEKFGIVADGVTDNTTGLQSALDSGEPLWAPFGDILITQPLLIPSHGIKLHGAGGTWKSASDTGSRIHGNFAAPLFRNPHVVLNANNTYTGARDDSYKVSFLDFVGIHFRQYHEQGDCIQLLQTESPTYFGRCMFEHSFRGLMLLESTFTNCILNCFFKNSWAGRDVDTFDFENAYALYLPGHSSVYECNWQSCGTAVQVIGSQANIFGGRIETGGIGLRVGGQNLSIDSVADGTPNITPLMRSSMMGMSFESNYRNLWLDNVGETCSIADMGIQGGTNVPGTVDGVGDYGVLVKRGHPSSSIMRISPKGRFKRAAIAYEDAFNPDIHVQQINATNIEAGAPVVEGTPIGVYGPSASRPSLADWEIGRPWYDTDLGKPIWSDGTVWRDAAGTDMTP